MSSNSLCRPGRPPGVATVAVPCALAAMVLLGNAGCVPADDVAISLAALETPAPAGSALPDLAVGADGRLYLSWVEPDGGGFHALRFSVLGHAGWDEPRTVARGEDWFVNWADFPGMAALADGTLAAHWRVKSAEATYAYDAMLSVSTDGGGSWSEPRPAHDDGTTTEHGFVSLLPVEQRFLVVWLDGRGMAEPQPGPMTLRSAWLDAAGEVSGERVVDEQVCDCCATDLASVPGGGVTLAYRDRSPEEVRDISLARLRGDAWSAGGAVHDDGWVIAGCPVNGPALASGSRGVGCAWFTMEDERGRVRLALEPHATEGFGEPVEIDGGDPVGRLDLVSLDEAGWLASWIERETDRAAIRVQRVDATGALAGEPLSVPALAARSSGVPRLARIGETTVLAWTAVEGEITSVRTARLSLR